MLLMSIDPNAQVKPIRLNTSGPFRHPIRLISSPIKS